MNDRIPVEARDFTGLGKMYFTSKDVSWNIPHLHFLVANPAAGVFEAINLEFGLVSTGSDPAESIAGLAAQTYSYIWAVMESGDNYGQFIETVDSHMMDEFWKQYRVIEFSLAREGNDLSHNIDKQIERAVRAIMNEKVDNALNNLAKTQAENLINEAKRIVILNKVFDFQYASANKAAA